jgi:hypothetical protein
MELIINHGHIHAQGGGNCLGGVLGRISHKLKPGHWLNPFQKGKRPQTAWRLLRLI